VNIVGVGNVILNKRVIINDELDKNSRTIEGLVESYSVVIIIEETVDFESKTV